MFSRGKKTDNQRKLVIAKQFDLWKIASHDDKLKINSREGIIV